MNKLGLELAFLNKNELFAKMAKNSKYLGTFKLTKMSLSAHFSSMLGDRDFRARSASE